MSILCKDHECPSRHLCARYVLNPKEGEEFRYFERAGQKMCVDFWGETYAW